MTGVEVGLDMHCESYMQESKPGGCPEICIVGVVASGGTRECTEVEVNVLHSRDMSGTVFQSAPRSIVMPPVVRWRSIERSSTAFRKAKPHAFFGDDPMS
jgi:hypothetical protein